MNRDGRLLLRIYVQPRASRNKFVGMYGDAMKLSITAPPVDGKANAAVISFLASFLKLKKKNIEIRSGLQSRNKTILIDGLSEEKIRAKIEAVSV
ncbi:MAG: YggU family protein [Desulfocapsa sp.]|nr:YggU family protein [Desulfocapsa sp.]